MTPVTNACVLCEKVSVKEFTYWKITENQFPYDLIAKTHHMLMPLRHVAESGFSEEELKEFALIKGELMEGEYDWLIESTVRNKSIPSHFHLHLIVAKPSIP